MDPATIWFVGEMVKLGIEHLGTIGKDKGMTMEDAKAAVAKIRDGLKSNNTPSQDLVDQGKASA